MYIFTHAPESYKRNIDVLPNYIEDVALYLSRMRNIPILEAREFVKRELKNPNITRMVDPPVKLLQRDKKTGDRAPAETTLFSYIKMVTDNKLIMAPTMTVYLNPNQKKSYNAIWINENLAKRKGFKHQKFIAQMKGDELKCSYFDILQNSCKIKNNSLSGAHASPSTPLFNKSSHSTLTSTCRISTSYANASNECLLMGNRHYWCPQVVLSHLITLSRHSDIEGIKVVVAKYNLEYPSVEDVMDCIEYSTNLYWRNRPALVDIRAFVETLVPAERAAFVYTGDLYHLEKHNPLFIKEFIFSMPVKSTVGNLDKEATDLLKDSDLAALAILVCQKEANKRQLDDIAEEDKEAYGIIAATAKTIQDATIRYSDFIAAFFRTDLLSPSIFRLPSIIRRAVVGSDTDSSIFTNQYWVKRYYPRDMFCEAAYNIGYTTTFLVSKIVKHKLAIMSANIGAIPEHIHSISMKNEYYFPVFALTPSAKHYYANKTAQEGNILPEIEIEIKGVHLRDSSAPAFVTKRLKQYIVSILEAVSEGRQLSLTEIYDPVAEIELAIREDVESGGFKYFKATQIKDADSYAEGVEAANYKKYLFWEEIYSGKYGHAPNPPYQAIKISVNTDSARKFRAWVEKIEDPVIRNNYIEWSKRLNKKELRTYVVPLSIILQHGVPKEIISAMNIRRIIMNIVKPFYLVMESLGLYLQNGNISRLISDTYVPTSRRTA